MDMCREMTESPGKPEMPGGKPGEGYGDFMEELSAPMRLLASREALLLWYEENKRDLPWRRDRDAYRIWISEIMLQQTRAAAVIPYYFRFMEHFPSVLALASKDEEELLKCWEGLGYYSRARNLKKNSGDPRRALWRKASGFIPGASCASGHRQLYSGSDCFHCL